MSATEKLVTPPHNRPGYRTTEFWLSFFAMLVGVLMTSGIISDGSIAMKIAGAVAFVFGQLGYAVPRVLLKRDSLKGSTVALVSKAAELAANALTSSKESAPKELEAAKPADPPRAE